MRRRIWTGLIALLLCLGPVPALAQGRPGQPPRPPAMPPAAPAAPTSEPPEIKLDESSSLRADAVQSRMQAILANLSLLQRQFQDLQTEWSRMLEERKKLVEDAGRKAGVDVKDTTEWAFDKQGQRYIHARPAQAAPSR